ncbi:MAG TPA: TRAP transporter small permease [Kiloniellaceae bacterium]|nr:TRAP transporter small permease [Kiloniellaceae bacterium]
MAVLRWFDDNLEKMIILVCYLAMAGIIFVEVIRRFAFGQQAPWSSTIPIYLFLWVTWIGCAYTAKKRSHLRFEELRSRMPYMGKFCAMMLDHILWIAFALLVIYFSVQQVQLSYDNFAIVPGTDDVMQWWFYMATPVAFTLLIVRVLQNLVQDVQRYRRGESLDATAEILE